MPTTMWHATRPVLAPAVRKSLTWDFFTIGAKIFR